MFRLIALAVFLFALAVIIFPEDNDVNLFEEVYEALTELEITTTKTQRVKQDVINLVNSTGELVKK